MGQPQTQPCPDATRGIGRQLLAWGLLFLLLWAGSAQNALAHQGGQPVGFAERLDLAETATTGPLLRGDRLVAPKRVADPAWDGQEEPAKALVLRIGIFVRPARASGDDVLPLVPSSRTGADPARAPPAS